MLSALFAGNNDATVTIFWPPHRVDVSLNFAIALLVTGFVLLYFALRALSVLFALPKQAKQWRSLQKERALNAHLFNAQSHFMAGRYLRARKAALAALDMDKAMGDVLGSKNSDNRLENAPQLRALAHVMVAQSAHALQDKVVRDEHLNLALEHNNPKASQETREGTQMLAAQWALDDRDAAGAALAQCFIAGCCTSHSGFAFETESFATRSFQCALLECRFRDHAFAGQTPCFFKHRIGKSVAQFGYTHVKRCA